MTTAPLPDAAPTNWVDRHAPAALRPWLKLGRFDRPVGIWLLLLPGWQAIAIAAAEQERWPSLRLIVLFALGAALMRAAGCAYNDIVDRDIDAKVARTASRPIPSGQISVKQAWAFVIVCCVVSLGILLTMGWLAIGLGAASLLLVAAYPFMKRITWWPQAWLGLTFNWGALLGYAAATGRLGLAPILLYASGIFWTLGYDTIYAIQDLEDDALAGVKSSARRLGRNARPAVLSFYVLAFGLAVAAAWAAHLGPLFLPFAGLYAIHLSRQALAVSPADPVGALRLFRSNRDAGLILFVGLAAGMWHGLGGQIARAVRMIEDRARFIRDNTRLQAPPHAPELSLYLADEITPIWRLTEEELGQMGLPPPFWAFAWAGGQALARYLLDNPGRVSGKRVLDFAAGSGIVAIAAMKAGAASAIAADIDVFCGAAVLANAEANGVAVGFTAVNLLDAPAPEVDLICAGDICYEKPLAERVFAWLAEANAQGTAVLVGDPGRSYFPRGQLVRLAEYQVPTTRELEDMEVKKTGVYAFPALLPVG